MATNDTESNALFHELQQEERAARTLAWWKQHGLKVLAASALFVAANAGWMIWQQQQLERNQRHTAQLSATIEQLQAADARMALETLKEAPTASAAQTALAGILRAQTLEEQKKQGEALDAWRNVAAMNNVDAALRDAARLAVVRLTNDAEEASRLLDATATPGAPYAVIALQTKIALAIAAGNPKAAETALAALKAIPNQPKAAQARTNMLASALVKNPAAAAPSNVAE